MKLPAARLVHEPFGCELKAERLKSSRCRAFWRRRIKKTQETPSKKDSTKQAVLHLAFELSNKRLEACLLQR